MSEIWYRSKADVTLVGFDFKSRLIKCAEYGFELIELFGECFGPNKHIVDVD